VTNPVASPGEGRTSPTLEEVAREAGVSRATVSRVINGQMHVSARAREAVTRAIERLGYVPNLAARSLVTRRTNSVALVVSEHGDRVFFDPFFAGVLRGVHAGLAGSQRQLILLMSQGPDQGGQMANYLCNGHVDGVLVISLHGEDPLPQRLLSAGVPVVLGGRPLGEANVPYVDADNFNGGLLAARYLVSLGRRRPVTIAGPKDMAAGLDRLAGWRRGMDEAGHSTDAVVHSDFTVEGGASAMRELLGRHPDLDAVFAASDQMAVGAMQVLQESGRRVPDDVAVVGFDDSVLATTTVPRLTTVRQPIEELGRTMTWRLLAQLNGEEGLPPSVLLPTELVRRESA